MTDEDENTVYTTSKKNRIQAGGKGPDKTPMRPVTLQVMVPAHWDNGKVQQTVQEAIVTELEIEEGQ